MNKKISYLTLGAAFVAGAVATMSLLTPGVVPFAVAQPDAGKTRTISSVSTTDMATLRSLNASFEGLAEYIAPSVVHIKSSSTRVSDIMGRPMAAGGQGSGVIFRPDGYIVTNDHVVGGFENVTVVLNDGREFPGKVTRAAESDIAVVKIEAKDLPAAKFGDSQAVKPGQIAIAVGSPFGLENSVTVGFISALARETVIQGRNYPDLIQTDAAINMGNSGGPLVNVNGEVVGINTAIYSETGGSMGIGFAIPSNQARMLAETLIEKGKVTRAYLGVLPENLKPYEKKEMNIAGGARLKQVPNDGPAAMGGLRAGDIVVRIGNYPVASQVDLRNTMMRYEPGSTVKIEYIRNGERKTAEVKLAPVPPSATANLTPGTPFGEVDPQDLDPRIKKFFEDSQGDVPAPRTRGRVSLGVGVESISESTRNQFNIPATLKSGAVVVTVNPGSTADKFGLKPGDVIEQVGSVAITKPDDLVEAIAQIRPGEKRSLKVTRFTKTGRSTQVMPVIFE